MSETSGWCGSHSLCTQIVNGHLLKNLLVVRIGFEQFVYHSWMLFNTKIRLSGKDSACQCRRSGFDPWSGKISWRRSWRPTQLGCQLTQLFLPGKSRGQTSLGSMGSQRVGHNLVTEQQQCFNNIIEISFHIPYNLPT